MVDLLFAVGAFAFLGTCVLLAQACENVLDSFTEKRKKH